MTVSKNRVTVRRRKFIRTRRVLIGTLITVLFFALLLGIMVSTTVIGYYLNLDIAKTYEPVKYEKQLKPILVDGIYTFITDEEFKIMQLTDIHIGGGFLTVQKDRWALSAMSTMISVEKPDLVIFTGDLAQPLGFQTGSFNNLNQMKMVAEMMESLEVYWTFVFGNHEDAKPCIYTKEELVESIMSSGYKYCLFQEGEVGLSGKGNHYINIKNTQGLITQTLIMLDSHGYREDGGYDNIKPDQVDWYTRVINKISSENLAKHQSLGLPSEDYKKPNSLLFFHIPLKEYEDAWLSYVDNGNTENTKLIYGTANGPRKPVNYGAGEDNVFDTVVTLGSTDGIFCGHDHLNNFQIEHHGVRLSYSYSIDYVAFVGIHKQGAQRGCTLIYSNPDGTWHSELSNYYQTKYKNPGRTELVAFD